MILILGKSTLSYELEQIIPNCVIVGKPEYDFSKQEDCDRLISNFSPKVVINTVGVMSDDLWNVLVTNYVGVAYVSLKFYEKIKNLQIINISSASTHWVSYPDINTSRLCYNISKESLTNFGSHMIRKTANNLDFKITTIEPGKFSSKMNNHTPGALTAAKVAEIIKFTIQSSISRISITN